MKILIIALWIIFFIYLAYLLFEYIRYKFLIKKLSKIPFPQEYKKYLQNIPEYQKLPKDLKIKIERSILLFINTKKFIGVKLKITDEIKVVISFFACLIVLNKNECYDELEYIYVYPHTMILKTIQNNGGIYNKETFLISGEAVGDSVIIAWDEAKKRCLSFKK
jgi:Mlc titration factor MtfA (ptsG expression regulator)